MPIKYLGSKRRLVPVLQQLAADSGARTALDLFTGTTRVAQCFKQLGLHVTCVDTARYSEVFGQAYVVADRNEANLADLQDKLSDLSELPGVDGYVTETFCRQSRYFQPHNGRRIDAIRDHLEHHHRDDPHFPILLTSLIEAADRVDSTTGLQMAYVKAWAPRSARPLELRVPDLLPGSGRSIRGDAMQTASGLDEVDLAYLDPPYNQHRYFTNYHIWETLVAWDAPEHYGIACKRIDSRDPVTKSVFNSKPKMPDALRACIAAVRAKVVVVSYNDESWLSLDELVEACRPRGAVAVLAFDSKRYVGAQIGIHNPAGDKVGTVSHLRNLEYVVLAGEHHDVERCLQGIDPSHRVHLTTT